MGIWRDIGSTRFQNLAVRNITIFHSTSGATSGNKLMGILNRMGMEFLSKFMGPFLVKSKLFKLVQGMISVAGPTSTQKDSVESQLYSYILPLHTSPGGLSPQEICSLVLTGRIS
eukprot:1162102-Pelagomonas_calceolata.AAC.8